jgi:hypothetical protein
VAAQQRANFAGQLRIGGFDLGEQALAGFRILLEQRMEQGGDIAPARGVHAGELPSSSRASHARATTQ